MAAVSKRMGIMDQTCFNYLSFGLSTSIASKNEQKIHNELCKILEIITKTSVDTVIRNIPHFLQHVTSILDNTMSRRVLDRILAIIVSCYEFQTVPKVKELIKGKLLNKILEGEKPWSVIITHEEPTISINFLKILLNYLPCVNKQKVNDKFWNEKLEFAGRVSGSDIWPFLWRAKITFVFLVDIYYHNPKSWYARKEWMQNVLNSQWNLWHNEKISFGMNGNCLVDHSLEKDPWTSEEHQRYYRRAWIFLRSKEELRDFGERFNNNKDTFCSKFTKCISDIYGNEQLLQKELREIATNILEAIGNRGTLQGHHQRRLKARRGDNSFLQPAPLDSDEEKEVWKSCKTELQSSRKPMLHKPTDISKDYTKQFDDIRTMYFRTRTWPNSKKVLKERMIYDNVKMLAKNLKAKETALKGRLEEPSDIFYLAVQWQSHLEENLVQVVNDAIKVYYLEFDPKNIGHSLCFKEERKALCNIFKRWNVDFTWSNFSWYPLMNAWTHADILYISGHSYGDFEENFEFESDWSGELTRRSKERVKEGLGKLWTKHRPKLVVLLLCRSEELGEWFLNEGVPWVVVSKRMFNLNDKHAINFLKGLSTKLVENVIIPEAFSLGQNFVMKETEKQESCCCQNHAHSCLFCDKHERRSCCKQKDCQRNISKHDDCGCTYWMNRWECCERTCTLDPKDSFKLLKRGILKCDSLSSDRFEFKKGSLRVLPGRNEVNRMNNIYPLGDFQRHTDTTKRCAVGEILMLLKERNKVVVVHSNGEPGLGKKKTCLAVCDHLLRNYLTPFKPPWENGIWQIKKSDIKEYLSNDDKK